MRIDATNQPITIENPSDLEGAPMSAIIGFDCPCEVCTYNNRGLAIGGICPECDASIQQTVGSIRIVIQPIWWLQRIVWGARLITFGVTILFVATTLTASSVCMQLIFANGVPGPFHEFWLFLVWAAGIVIFAAGWLVLTWRTPFAMSRRSGAESATRMLALMICVTTAAGASIIALVELTPWSDAGLIGAVLVGLGALTAVVCTPILFIFGLIYITAIALRIPSRSLARNSLVMLIVVLVSIMTCVVIIPFFGWQVAGLGSAHPFSQIPTRPDIWVAFAIGWGSAIVATGGYAILFRRFSSRFASVLADAQSRQTPPAP